MTALKQYQRLESGGFLSTSDKVPPQEVLLSFGSATLMITDFDGQHLSHWSLAAIHRLNPGERPAEFRPAPEADEHLKIEDDVMIDAIETVRRTVEASIAAPRRRKRGVVLATVVAMAAIVGLIGPEFLVRQTLSVVPSVKRSEIGATVLGHLQAELGPTCRETSGLASLAALRDRLVDDGTQIVVLPRGFDKFAALPGGLIALDQAMIEDHDDPHITAGHILSAQAHREQTDPLEPLLRHGGWNAAFQLLTTGDLPSEYAQSYARHLIDTPQPEQAADIIEDRFVQAELSGTAYLATRGMTPNADIALKQFNPVLQDADWVALQGICLD